MDQSEFILGMVAILTGGTIVITLIRTVARTISRRSEVPLEDSGGLVRIDDRLGRMEQAIDAMAVEVERISEGQRFTSKLLAERAREPERLPR